MVALAILGAGNLGTSIAEGIVKRGILRPEEIVLSRRNVGKLAKYAEMGARTTNDNIEAAKSARILMLCVQPRQIDLLIEEISPAIDPERHIIVSTVTGVMTEEIQALLKRDDVPIVRAMPNTAIAIGASMTCLCSSNASDGALRTVRDLFDGLGRTLVIEEKLIKAATVLAASNIAFFMRIIRALTQGGIQLGFSSEDAQAIAVQVAKGAAQLLQENETHPEIEIDKVTTPQGCTIEGLNEMEHQGLSSAIIKGLVASYEKIANIK